MRRWIDLGIAGSLFGIIMLILPMKWLMTFLIILGAGALWVVCLISAWWLGPSVEDWLDDKSIE